MSLSCLTMYILQVPTYRLEKHYLLKKLLLAFLRLPILFADKVSFPVVLVEEFSFVVRWGGGLFACLLFAVWIHLSVNCWFHKFTMCSVEGS